MTVDLRITGGRVAAPHGVVEADVLVDSGRIVGIVDQSVEIDAARIVDATGRYVRTVGVPDVAPMGPFIRRFGGVVDRPDEIAGLLRAGQLVGLPMTRDIRNRERVGRLEVARIQAAIDTGVPVVPVALAGREVGRLWRLVVGKPVAPRRRGGPLAAAELAEDTRVAVQELLDDALPASWWW